MRKRRLLLVVGGLLLLGLSGYLVFGDTAVRQAIRLRRARGHRPVVEQVLRGDPAFVKVTVGVVTSGAIAVLGTVSTSSDEQRLRAAVATTQPPVPVLYQVRVE